MDAQTDLWSVEVADYHLRVLKREAFDDLLAHGGAAVAVNASRTSAPSTSA